MSRVFYEKKRERLKRGRPPGETAQGKAMKKHLYKVSLDFIQKNGYQSATLRKIAEKAGVSSGLFYKYFPSKSAIISLLYEDLSKQFENKTDTLSNRVWILRVMEVLELSLSTLKPYRKLLFVLIPILIGDPKRNVFSHTYRFSRQRIEKGFLKAIEDSSNKPKGNAVKELARIFYVIHLGILLFWLLDKSSKQFVTKQMMKIFSSLLAIVSLSLKFSKSRKLISRIHLLVTKGLYDEGIYTNF